MTKKTDFSALLPENIAKSLNEPKSHAEMMKHKVLTENAFPHVRMRRLRQSEAIRNLVRENSLSANDLIYPLFIEEDLHERTPIDAMPGIFRETEKSVGSIVKEAADNGVRGVMVFGVSHHKDHTGSDSMSPNGLLARMIDRAKQAAPEAAVIADLCFCEYTDHGHCGPINERGDVDNDKTVENIAMQAVIAAEAGADIVAPSGMMDGQVAGIRHALDVTGFSHVPVMAYAAKFASNFYGPFRDAAGCSLGHDTHVPSHRKTYQMDPANGREAIRDALMDEAEGADMLMVKPGMAYLDILKELRQKTELPLAAYQVSGEYAMMKFAAQAGALDFQNVMLESLMAFKRAGADMVLSYSAIEAAKWINNSN